MKNLLIATLIFFSINIINSIGAELNQIKIKNILSKNVPLGGYLFLEAEGIAFLLYKNLDKLSFTLSSIYEKDKTYSSFSCAFYWIEEYYKGEYESIIIGCQIQKENSFKLGKYYFSPLENEENIQLSNDSNIKLNILNINESFNIIEGEELLYFSNHNPNELFFKSNKDSETIGFELFESVSYREAIISLDDIEIKCKASGNRMVCPISASDLPQDKRFQTFNVYIKDSKGNKFRNYLTFQICITLNYIEKKTLKIKVTKLLTNYLTMTGYIAFDTLDQTLENILFSKEGFNLKLKKENSDLKVINLLCGFHKHQRENTKIFCLIPKWYDDMQNGTYILEEYISGGPLEDEKDKISKNYQIIVPSFKSDRKIIFNNYKEIKDEIILDFHLREKIELIFKNKEDIEVIFFNLESYYDIDYEINKYFLGNNQLKCDGKLLNRYLICEVPGINFEKSGIYYMEKKNALGEKERLYFLPYIEVLVSWD